MNVVSYYRDATLFTRALVAARPLICPLDPILAWVPAAASVLEIGCGVGLLSLNLAVLRRPSRICAFDINANSISIATFAAKRVADVSDVPLTFYTARDFAEWPADVFDVVCMVDVAHHVPRELQQDLFQAAAARVREGGLFLYKDMATTPWWCALGNRLHDLVLARQWIRYCPRNFACEVLQAEKMRPIHRDEWRRYWYAHEFVVFKKIGVTEVDPVGARAIAKSW